MTSVVLTGASGFVGRPAAAALLAKGCTVTAVSRRPERAPDGVTPVAADLLGDPEALRRAITAGRPEILVHAAWSTEHGRYWTDPRNLDWTASTLALVKAFVEAGGRRVVTVGTCAEYDWSGLGTGTCDEASTPLRPHTLYGAAKHATAQVVAAFCRVAGVEHAHARLFMLYGADEQPGRLVPVIIGSLLAGERAALTSGRQVRDFMEVRDAGAALAAVADSALCGSVNLASGRPTSVRALAEAIGLALGRPDLIGLGELADRPDDPPYLVAAIDRMMQEVGFRPGVDLLQGLHDAIEHWRSRKASETR